MLYSGSGSMTIILSVSVATYNASKTIEQCLDSFINSKYVRLSMSRILCKFLRNFCHIFSSEDPAVHQ